MSIKTHFVAEEPATSEILSTLEPFETSDTYDGPYTDYVQLVKNARLMRDKLEYLRSYTPIIETYYNTPLYNCIKRILVSHESLSNFKESVDLFLKEK